MPNEMTPQNLKPESSASVLEVDEIQGDVLLGLQKLHERFVFFEITNVAGFKSALRHRFARRVTTTRMVQLREFELREFELRDPRARARGPLANVGLNFGLTSQGLAKLVANADLGDPAYAAGAKTRAAELHDPVDDKKAPTTWTEKFAAAAIDGVFLITGGTNASIQEEIDMVRALFRDSMVVTHEERGEVRPGVHKGHEHFGWLDGISQPAITGLTDPFPGQRSLDPGLFTFGYGVSRTLPLPWMKNGSLMVFRRLKQLVPEFDQFLLDEAKRLGIDPVLLGARMVGRWKSGAPLAMTPLQDDPVLGGDPLRNNDFDFADDQGQRRCPFAAHIRKTNPREDLVQAANVDAHRIMRAGIPFGPELDASEKATMTTDRDRGLLFVCYQTNIGRQFEFVQSRWANNPEFVFKKERPSGGPVVVGIDPIIGQSNAPDRARSSDEPIPNYPTGNVRSALQMPTDFVIPTGAAYFFMPSIDAIRTVLSA